RRSQCVNNLKQIGLALLSYEGSLRTLPPGYVSNYDTNGDDTGPGWGWAAMILPQMEQVPTFNTINFPVNIERADNLTARLPNFAVFLCPSDSVKPEWWAMSRGPVTGAPLAQICQVAPSHYVGMYGITEPGVDGEGLFFRDSRVALRDITDGASQTIAVGER